MTKKEYVNLSTKANEVSAMPTIELLECERVAYVNGMKKYLQRLKAMPSDEAMEKSRISLVNCNIIESTGEFTERYRYSKKYAKSKR